MASNVRAFQKVKAFKRDPSKATEEKDKILPLTLQTLPYDILIHICEYLAPEDGPWPCQDPTCNICFSQHKLLVERNKLARKSKRRRRDLPLNINYYAAISRTSKFLREISIPFLFRAMRIAPRTGIAYERLARELLMMEGKGIFESVRKLSIVFSPDIYLDENLCLRNEFPVFKQSNFLITSMEIILRNIKKLEVLQCKIDFVEENLKLNSLPLAKETKIPVETLMISYGCGSLLSHLEPQRLLIKEPSNAIWYHIVRAQIGVTYKSTVNTRTHALRIRGADHPEADTRVPRLYKDLTTCANSLTELRIFTFIMDNTGLKDLVQCVPRLERLHLENHWHSWSRPDALTLFDMSVTLSCLYSLVYLYIWNDSDSAREYDIRDEHIHASFAQNCRSLQQLALGIHENTVICNILRDESGNLIPEKTQLRARDKPEKRVLLRYSPHQGRNFVKSFLDE
ncbi:hypothetical protein TWF788_003783 [Orbilia oligospora]|uniref:Uncharacterized protein n=1 Tax=Orbilia oligospora TaxID=2813651 RepID=A0A7C8P978_ORBOL|nr:hypothetical protein TWF788_003783 [Orbilia oligospora]